MDSFVEKCLGAIRPYINGTAETCSYCDHLYPLILAEGQHTYITLAIGQIVEGYLQLCTHKHRTACTGLYEYETSEFLKMKEIIRNSFSACYGTRGIAFEHGKAGSCLWGEKAMSNLADLCHHTHLHFVPVDVNIRPAIRKLLPEEIAVHSIQELKKIREEHLFGDSYLYFEDSSEIGYVYPVGKIDIPRQFLRTCLAEELGVPERADWCSFPGEEYFASGRDKLQPVLNKFLKEWVEL